MRSRCESSRDHLPNRYRGESNESGFGFRSFAHYPTRLLDPARFQSAGYPRRVLGQRRWAPLPGRVPRLPRDPTARPPSVNDRG